jgi:hypothetical protein
VADKNFKVKSGLNIPITSAAILTTDVNGNISSTAVLPITAGGTGQTSATNAINALLPVQNGSTVNYAIQSDGTNINWGKLYNQTIKNNDSTVTPRGIVNFVGASFTDSSGTDTTTITLNPTIKTIDEKTTNYTVQTSDNNKILEINSPSNTTITIPTNTMDSIPNGTTISIVKKGQGNIIFAESTSSLPLSKNTINIVGLTDVSYGSNLFVGIYSGQIYSSSDGITWTQRATGLTNTRFVKFLNNKFYVGSQNAIHSSSDGITWTQVYSLLSIEARDMDYANNKFIAACSNARILTSSDGITWTLTTGVAGLTTQAFRAIIYTNSNTWYMSASATPFMVKSVDNGNTWTSLTVTGSVFNVSSYPTSFYFNGTYILARVIGSQTPTRYSLDGQTWTSISGTVAVNSTIYSHSHIKVGSTIYLLIPGTFTNQTTAYLYSSTDFITWTLSTTLEMSENIAAAGRGAVSDSGTLLWVSSDKSRSFTTGTESTTINSLDASKNISKRYGKVDLYKYESNGWVLTGDLDSKTVDVELNSEQYYNLMGVF